MKSDNAVTDRPTSTEDIARQMNQQPPTDGKGSSDSQAPLLPGDVAQRLQSEWSNVQAGFVDEPRKAVEHADELVAFAIKQIAETFARERSALEAQWDREGEVSTEDLRVALTRYRSFFHRLLSM